MTRHLNTPTRIAFQHLRSLARTLASVSLLALIASCGGGGNSTSAPQPNPGAVTNTTLAVNASVDSYVQSELQRQNIPGLALVVLQNGKTVYEKGYGYTNLEQMTPTTTGQRFQIGSITKQFVAAAVMLLVEDGKMALDDKISKYLGPVPQGWEAITVRHILSHTSGLPTDPDAAFDRTLNAHGPYTADQLLAAYKAYALQSEPGKVYSYSNVGYQLMGVLIEKVTGAFYGDLIQSRIFTPLGLTTARFIEADSPAGSATGYFLQNNKVTPLLMTTLSAGEKAFYRGAAGGIEMGAVDLAKWDASLYTEKILKKSSLDQMWTPGVLIQAGSGYSVNYGLGWFVSDYNGHLKVYHSGGMASFTTDYLRYTNDKLSVIVLTNLGSDSSDPETISRAVANMYLPGILPAK
jgi:CubicO group peptidase (beta-lactamase class C family)